MLDRLRSKTYIPTAEEISTARKTLDGFVKRGQLTPESVQQFKDVLKIPSVFGVDRRDLMATRRVVDALARRPDLNEDEIGAVIYALEEEEQYATEDKVAQQRKIEGRRRFIKGAASTTLVLGTMGGVARIIYDNFFSEEAARKSAEDQAKRAAQERTKRENLERNNYLSSAYSTPSMSGWRVRYDPYDPNVDYKEKEVFVISPSSSSDVYKGIQFFQERNWFGNSYYKTDIYPSGYTTLDGVRTVKLQVVTSRREGYSYSEEWLLGDSKQPGQLDTRAVVFNYPQKQLSYFVQINGTRSNDGSIEVRYMEKSK